MDVLLVDDHPEVRQSLAEFLGQLGHTSRQAGSGREALTAIRTRRPDLVVSDVRMPDMGGLALLQALEAFNDPPPLALMTAFGDADAALEALRLGAVDYLRKPIDVRELHQLVERTEALRQDPPVGALRQDADGLVISSPDLERVVALADRLHRAPDLPCLIEGETGTGKELIARRIHHGGGREPGPFVALNCAAISPGLFEAELFGYVAGAFTGAAPGGSPGKCVAAAGGTLFLDEIGDLPADQQAKLLRLLEDHTFYPVGGSKVMKLSARVVCATNVGLIDRMKRGAFREDLYYRLKVGHLRLPALRQCRDAIVPLARVLLERAARRRTRSGLGFSSDAETWLRTQDWPGNVRQLLHVIEQAALLIDGTVIDRGHLSTLLADGAMPSHGTATIPAAPLEALRLPRLPDRLILDPAGFDLDTWERAIVLAALDLHNGSPGRCATYLGISRKVLYTLRKRYGLLGPGSESESEPG